MTILAIDDTDSRTLGMCTTYVGHLIAEELKSDGHEVERVMLIRLNPAAKHKTRGNAAVSIHTNAQAQKCLDVASEFVQRLSADADDMTNPGVVVSPNNEVSEEVSDFTHKALTSLRTIGEAEEIIEQNGFLSYHLGNGRGRIGCLAAIGAWDSLEDWTYECISYRDEEVRGTERQVDIDSVFEECEKYYPEAWDTVDRNQGSAVCIPNAPGPILYGIRGDHRQTVENLSEDINNLENIESYQTFVTNQGTDAHIVRSNSISDMSNNTAYQVKGNVSHEPHTEEGGHVFLEISDGSDHVEVAAFEPTKHFRRKVRELRVGDEIVVNGEYDDGTVKLEKLKIVSLNRTKLVNPTCEECGNSMESAGANQGYRCRNCKTSRESKEEVAVEREISNGWHEVPPCARRHIAKPLTRGGFDGQINPFK